MVNLSFVVWLAAVRFLGCWSDRELSRDAALGLDFFFVGVTRLGFAATDALLGFCVVVAGFCVVVGEDGFFEVFAASSTSLTGMSVGDFVEVGVPRRPTGSTAIVGNPESLRARSSTVTILRKQPLFHVFPKQIRGRSMIAENPRQFVFWRSRVTYLYTVRECCEVDERRVDQRRVDQSRVDQRRVYNGGVDQH